MPAPANPAIIPLMLPNPICVIRLVVDLILGPEEPIAYVSVTTR